eukprot:3752441-Rhodomonas_salina.1
MFEAPPSITNDGILHFVPKLNVFGTTSVTVTLQDNGGNQFGEAAFSPPAFTVIEIAPVNHPPDFALSSALFVLEGKLDYTKAGNAEDLTAGPDNENGVCNTMPGGCENQSFAFNFISASNPNLFTKLPSMDSAGTLHFSSCFECSGSSDYCMAVVDVGAGTVDWEDCVPCNDNITSNVNCCFAPEDISTGVLSSPPRCSKIYIEPVDTAPGFNLGLDVECGTKISTGPNCYCVPLTDPAVFWAAEENHLAIQNQNGSCIPADEDSNVTVTVLEDAGPLRISDFVSGISAANNFVEASFAVFSGMSADDVAQGNIDFRARRIDDLFRTPGLEFAVDLKTTAEGFTFFAEQETNSVSLWSTNEDGSLTFEDRRSDLELRVRLRKNEDLAQLQGMCAAESLAEGGTDYILAATGCDQLFESPVFTRNDTDTLEAEWAGVLAHWDFSTPSMYNGGQGVMKVNAFSGHIPQQVTCDDVMCKYTRNKITFECAERYSTEIAPATFRDLSNRMGAAVFMGRGESCKAGTEHDTPKEHTLSATNVVASANGIEAIQFDRTINIGLWISDNIDELVTGDPATSQLPLEAMSAEIWFSVGVEDTSEHPLFSTMQKRTCRDRFRPVDCGCEKGWILSWRFKDSTHTQLVLSVGLALDAVSRNPDMYGTAYDQWGVGDGVGIITYSEWVAPVGFAKFGDWVHFVATYDGEKATIFANGTKQQEEDMCPLTAGSCGNIIYPASYHTCPDHCSCPNEACLLSRDCPCGSTGPSPTAPNRFRACLQGIDAAEGLRTPVTIGRHENKEDRTVSNHVGMMKQIRLYKTAIPEEYVASQFSKLAHMKDLPLQLQTYWYNSNGQGTPAAPLCQPQLPMLSPDTTYFESNFPGQSIQVRGNFLTTSTYKARFSYSYLLPEPHTVSPLDSTCVRRVSGVQQWLECDVPEWDFGYKAALLSIMEQPVGQPGFTFLWSKACFRQQCGYVGLTDAQRRLKQWAVQSDCCNGGACNRYFYSTAISGVATRVRFITRSLILQPDWTSPSLAVSTVAQIWKTREASPMLPSASPLNGVYESKTMPTMSSLLMTGASVIRAFSPPTSDDTFIFVANYWDGYSTDVQSSLLRLDNASTGDTTMIQGIPTSGARDFTFLTTIHGSFVAIAELTGISKIYRWRGATRIENVVIMDRGSGYVDGEVRLGCTLPAQNQDKCSGELEFKAALRVDGTPDGSRKGQVQSVAIQNMGRGYLTDQRLRIVYPGSEQEMENTITASWLKQARSIVCAMPVLAASAVPSTTSGCSNESMILDADGGSLQLRVTAVNNLGAIMGVTVVQTGNRPLAMKIANATGGATCQCLASSWSACIALTTNPFDVKINADPQGGSGTTFEAFAKWDAFGQIVAWNITNHGNGFLTISELTLSVRLPTEILSNTSNMTIVVPGVWRPIAPTGDVCTCILGAAWSDCIGMSRPQGSFTCYGGDRNGRACSGVDDVTSCQPFLINSVSTGNKGICQAAERARLVAAPLFTEPTRRSAKHFNEQSDTWEEYEGISRSVPIDLDSATELPVKGASGLALFDEDGVTYIAASVFFDADKGNFRAPSAVMRLTHPIVQGRRIALAVVHQTLPTHGAYGVTLFDMNWCVPVCAETPHGTLLCESDCSQRERFLIIPSYHGTISPLYRWDRETKLFELVQQVPTTRAISAAAFNYEGTAYFVISQAHEQVQMMRWNGTNLYAESRESTLPNDSAGGQLLPMTTAGAALPMSVDGEVLVLVGSFRGSDLSSVSQTYRAFPDQISGLRGPIRVAMHPNNHIAYTLGYDSQSIITFDLIRQHADGPPELNYRHDLSLASDENIPLLGLSDFTLSGGFMYTASSVEEGGKIHVFKVDTGNGSAAHVGRLIEMPDLHVSAESGPYGLRGVRAISAVQDWVFTASFVDKSIS